MKLGIKRLVLLTSGLATASLCAAQFVETEPNDSKAAANVFAGLINGSTITGNSTASTLAGLDYYRISTAAASLGIYRHRLIITSNIAGHTGTIRGLNQVAAALGPWTGTVGTAGTTDTTMQTTSTTTTPARFNQWYGFGKQEEIYYRVTGTATTTADYIVNYEVSSVTPTALGTFQAGQIDISTFGQGHTTDTDFWVYDSNLNPIVGYGNDDEDPIGGSPGTGISLQSFLRRNYGNGSYFLAMTSFNFANDQGSPSDDGFRTGALMDFPNSALNSSTTLNQNVAFAFTDSAGTTQFAATKVGPYDVNWYSFNVVPEPTTFAVLGLGAIALLRKRAKK